MLKNWLKILLILILISILILGLFRHNLVRFLLTNAVASATGLKLSIEYLNLDVLKSSLEMRGVTLFNPPGFKNEVLGKAKEISIKYDLLGPLTGRLHFRQVQADIQEINIIRNEAGSSNVARFKKGLTSPDLASEEPKALPVEQTVKISKGRTRPKFVIDSLEVSLAKLSFINYNANLGEPAVIIFASRGPLAFKNVNNLNNLVGSISIKMGFQDILENYLNNIFERISPDILKNTTGALKKKIQNILPKKR